MWQRRASRILPDRALSKTCKSEAARHDGETQHKLVRRAGLAFAYVWFAISMVMIGAAIYLLPLPPKAKLFLVLATGFLISLFVFMAIITHLAIRGGEQERWPENNSGAD